MSSGQGTGEGQPPKPTTSSTGAAVQPQAEAPLSDTRINEMKAKWLEEQVGKLTGEAPATVPETESSALSDTTDQNPLKQEIATLKQQLQERDDKRKSELFAMMDKADQKRYAEKSVEILEFILEDRRENPKRRGIAPRKPDAKDDEKKDDKSKRRPGEQQIYVKGKWV